MNTCRRVIKKLLFLHTIFLVIVFAISLTTLMASDLSDTYKDGVRFELRLASMEKVAGWKSVPSPWHQPVWLSSTISLCNSDVAQASAEQRGDTYSVSLRLTEEGTLKLARLTKANIGEHVAVILNDRAVSFPKIIDEISGGQAEIAGNFTEEEARSVAEGIMKR